MRSVSAVVALALAACRTVELPPEDETTGSTTDASSSTTDDTSTGEPPSSSTTEASATTGGSSTGGATGTTGEPSTGAPSTNEPSTGAAPFCGDGVLDPGEQCDGAGETAECDDDCSLPSCGDQLVNEAAGEECDDGENGNKADACLPGCVAASCGDGFAQADVEDCDDGNLEAGDGCDEACALERWSHVGVAHDVPVADLHHWEQCWVDTYEAGDPVTAPLEACAGDHLLVACRPVGADALTVAAHGPRAAVTKEVNYDAKERSTANGVDFFWAPYWGVIGFGPAGDAWCFGEGQSDDDALCWRADPEVLLAGVRCGANGDILGINEPKAWERLVFQAWD